MGKQSPPPPPPLPDPYKTSAAQTQGDVQSAIANSILQNPDVTTPFGQSTSQQIGTFQIKDAEGKPIDVPKYSQTQTLSPSQQKLYEQQTGIGFQMNDLASAQLGRLNETLNQPINFDGILKAPTNLNRTPILKTKFSSGGPIQKSVDLNDNAPTTFGQTAGGIQYGLGATDQGIQYDVGPTDFSKDRDKVERALLSRVQPMLDSNRSALESRLANQGIGLGSRAYGRAIDESNRTANDAYMQAVLAGGQEQSRLFGLNLQQGQFANAAQQQDFNQIIGRGTFNNAAQLQDYAQLLGRGQFEQAGISQNNAATLGMGQFANAAQAQQFQQNGTLAEFSNNAKQQMFGNDVQAAQFAQIARERAIQERLSLRNQPINEISALMNGGQVTAPQFQPFSGGQIAGSTIGQNIMGKAALENQQWQAQVQAAAQNNAAMYGMLGSVMGGLMKFSDIRLKRDVNRMPGASSNGLPVYFFRYLDDDDLQVGFMAHEVAELHPEAVYDVGGFLAVDYERAVI
jgi:hypothetical protein